MKDQTIVFLATPFIHTAQSVLGGWVLSKMWEWFVISSFENVPSVTWVAMTGFLLIVGYFRNHFEGVPQIDWDKVDGLEVVIKSLTLAIFRPMAALFFAWIITLLI